MMSMGRQPGHGRNRQRMQMAEWQREAAIAAADPGEKLLLAYQAARAMAGVLLVPRAPGRRGPTAVWDRLAAERPEMAEWAAALKGYSRLAQALEAGLSRPVPKQMAADFLWAVGEFFNRVEAELSGGANAA